MGDSRSSAKDSSSSSSSSSSKSHGGHNKTLSILDISKAYKFLTSKLYPSDHKSPHSTKSQPKLEPNTDHSHKESSSSKKKNAERIARSDDATTSSSSGGGGGGSSPPHEDSFFLLRRRPSFLSKSSSKRIVDTNECDDESSSSAASKLLSRSRSHQRSKTPTFVSSLTRSFSRSRSRTRSKSTTRRRSSSIMDMEGGGGDLHSFGGGGLDNNNNGPLLSRNMSHGSEPSTPNNKMMSRSLSGRSTPIVFSQSAARRKPQPMEMKLECTLEDLLSGCIKKVVLSRDVLSDFGTIEKEEETLRINVKPGWRKGTKITFEGKGDEKPGYLPADVVFVVDEVWHPLFKRKENEDDDLEIAVEIPLVQALTGGMLYVPLLGGETMPLLIEEIVYPGYQKVIPDQGMPCCFQDQEQYKRGALCITFSVVFPKQLTLDQRLEISSILQLHHSSP